MTDDHAGEFQALLDGWAAAIVANDPDRIARFTEPDWVIVTPEGGPAALDLFLGFVASGDLTHSAMTFELIDARVFDGVAVVVAHGTNEGMFQGHRFSADEWVTEVFVRRADGWRCTMSALTPNYAVGGNPQKSP